MEAADHAMADFLLDKLPEALEIEADRRRQEDDENEAWLSQRFEGDEGDNTITRPCVSLLPTFLLYL